MKYKDLKINETVVGINKHQMIYVDYPSLQAKLTQIKFPVIIVDTEFFNRSHDKDNIEPKLYDENEKDIVYLMNYSFAKNFREIENRNNFKSINSLSIRRKPNDEKYNFKKQYDTMIKSFISMCINKKIKSIIFAGQDNDKKIIEQWINNYKWLFKNRKTDLFVFQKETGRYTLNSFDIYDALEHNLSFTNFDHKGEKFYNEQNLKSGKVDTTIAIRSLTKFFDYTHELHHKYNFAKDNIRFLCVKALKLFSAPELSNFEHAKLSNYLKEARKHCYEDVLKILILIKFLSYINTKQLGATWASV